MEGQWVAKVPGLLCVNLEKMVNSHGTLKKTLHQGMKAKEVAGPLKNT